MSTPHINEAVNTRPIEIPTLVQELVSAANAVDDAAKVMKNCKEESRKISKIALDIARSVQRTAVTAQRSDEAAKMSVGVAAALGATKDVLAQCSSFMRDVARKSLIGRQLQKSTSAETVGGYLAAVEGLRELLKVQGDECGLMLRPFAGLGVDVSCTKELLAADITTVNAAYDGLKTTLNVMVNITDGLVWPLKAAPQTLLYILKLFEDCQGVHSKIASLLYDIQDMWTIVEDVSKAQEHEERLLPHLSGFFETLQRIAIRLHVALRVGKTKRTMAIHTIIACLDLEKERLSSARRRISLVFQGATLIQIDRLTKMVAKTHLATQAAPLASDMSVSATLPPKPIVFHGRDAFVGDAVQLLVSKGTARLAVLGSGGMGKTSVALAILHDTLIANHFRSQRFFVSCEAHIDPDAVVVALARLFGLEPSKDLLTTVVAHIANGPRMVLVLDNIETVWLAGGVPVIGFEELLGTLAQIETLSLIITCRGTILPQSVLWSNVKNAALEPFSLEAAVKTFEDRAGGRLAEAEEDIATQLLIAVDRMPLAVTLLGQLAQRGNSVSELLARWNREHSTLLQTYGAGRFNNIEVSIQLSIAMMLATDDSQESLKLLSVCSMLPDGLRPAVFEKMRPQFKNIDRARDNLYAYALASLGVDRTLKTLSPVRHLVIERYPAELNHHDSLCSIYCELADQLPTDMSEEYKGLAAAAAPEMGNLASLMMTLVTKPTFQILMAVIGYTSFMSWQQPNLVVASALLPYLAEEPMWKAVCLQTIGKTQYNFGDYRAAFNSFTVAGQLYLEVGMKSLAAWCVRMAGNTQRLLNEYDRAEALLNEAHALCDELDEPLGKARCRMALGDLMRTRGDHAAAVAHLCAAKATFHTQGQLFEASQCSESLGVTYIEQGELDSAVVELEASRSAFISFGNPHHLTQSTRYLSSVRRLQGDYVLAEQLLREAEAPCKENGDRWGQAGCAQEFGYLRRDQGRVKEAITHFESAVELYDALEMRPRADKCRDQLELLSSRNDWL